jgi:hypothetical protein
MDMQAANRNLGEFTPVVKHLFYSLYLIDAALSDFSLKKAC